MTNVLLVVLDSVRARNTSLHGYERTTTPFLDEFADQATTYTQARAPGTGSIQSHTSIFTGLHVAEHRMNDVDRRLASGHTIWEELAADGYDTGVFSYNSFLTQASLGLADAFETVCSGERDRVPYPDAVDPTELESSGPGRHLTFLSKAVRSNRPAASILNGLSMWERTRSLLPERLRGNEIVPDSVFTDRFADWLANREGPWAACLNYMGAHVPYLPAPEYNEWAGEAELDLMYRIDDHAWDFISGERPWSEREALERLYDGCIRQVDAELRRLIGVLEERDSLDDTLVVVTADHGEGFGEPGEIRPVRSVAHGSTGGLEEGVVHVPLVVRYPASQGGRTVETVVSLTRFPAVVRAVREDGGTADEFVPDDRTVLASSLGLSDAERESVPESVDDVAPYEPSSEAVYRLSDDGRIEKTVRWDGRVATFDCTEPPTVEQVSTDGRRLVRRAFDSLSPSGTVVADPTEPTDDVKARLEELGYR